MKISYLAILACIFSLISCNQELEKVNNIDGNKQIRFNITETRGTPITSVNQVTNFGVLAYYTGNGASNNWNNQESSAIANFMNNVEVSKTANGWSYTNSMYWPEATDANISFFAYAPYATENNGAALNGIAVLTTQTGTPQLTYSVPTNFSNQPDLLIAVPQKDLNIGNSSNRIGFNMKHALTCIGFEVTSTDENIVISEVKITDVVTKGTLSIDGSNIAWSLDNTSKGDFKAGINNSPLSTENFDLMRGDGYLMMIPQEIGENTKVVVTIKDDEDNPIELSLFEKGSWIAGQRLTYKINISTGVVEGLGSNVIYFDEENVLRCGKYENIPGSTDIDKIKRMAMFKMGSVIGLVGNNQNNWTSDILLNPTSTTHFNTWNDIGCLTQEEGSIFKEEEGWTISLSKYHNGTNIKTHGKGDPCKLVGLKSADIQNMTITELDNYRSGWRTPTSHEQLLFTGLENKKPNNWGEYLNSDYNFLVKLNGINGAMLPCGDATEKEFFPVAGYRDAINGRLESQNELGYYRSSNLVTGISNQFA